MTPRALAVFVAVIASIPMISTAELGQTTPVSLVNAGFESGDLTGWIQWGGSGCSSSASLVWAAEGTFSAYVEDASPLASCGLYQEVAVVPGELYSARVTASLLTGVAQLYLRWVDENGDDVGAKFPATTVDVPGIHKVTATGIAPPGAAAARIWWYTPTSHTGTSFIDVASLVLARVFFDSHPSSDETSSDPAPPVTPPCATESEYHVRVVYARPATRPDSYNVYAPQLRNDAAQMNGLVVRDSGGYAQIPFLCSLGQIVVENVVLAIDAANDDYWTISDALRLNVRMISDHAKYAIFYDDTVGCDCAGEAWFTGDTRNEAGNSNNIGPDPYALDYHPKSWTTLLHELTHALGAVQVPAPNRTPGGHCTDENDLMCYDDDDNGPITMRNVCSGYARFDCRHDDYFAPFAKPGTLLGDNWQIGSPHMRFLRFGCAATSTVGGFHGMWYVRDTFLGGVADACVKYGAQGDKTLVGDWDNDGRDGFALVNGNTWRLNNDLDGGTEMTFSYGLSSDKPIVGDWNGDGVDTPGVWRTGRFFLNNHFDGVADIEFNFGSTAFPNDIPVAGDFDGDGFDDVALVRVTGSDLVWHINLNRVFDGSTDITVTFGPSNGAIVVGDWDGDGRDTPGYVVNGNQWNVKRNFESSTVDTFTYGSWWDKAYTAGDWDGDPLNISGPAVLR